jgi:hypothetical protein
MLVIGWLGVSHAVLQKLYCTHIHTRSHAHSYTHFLMPNFGIPCVLKFLCRVGVKKLSYSAFIPVIVFCKFNLCCVIRSWNMSGSVLFLWNFHSLLLNPLENLCRFSLCAQQMFWTRYLTPFWIEWR